MVDIKYIHWLCRFCERHQLNIYIDIIQQKTYAFRYKARM